MALNFFFLNLYDNYFSFEFVMRVRWGGESEMMIEDCCSYSFSSLLMTSFTFSVSWVSFCKNFSILLSANFSLNVFQSDFFYFIFTAISITIKICSFLNRNNLVIWSQRVNTEDDRIVIGQERKVERTQKEQDSHYE
jgi:hypothetical protein